MYQDVKRLRKNKISINLDDYEFGLLQALVNYTGEERAKLARKMIMAGVEQALLGHDPSYFDSNKNI